MWRLDGNVSGSEVVGDSINSGPEPRIRPVNVTVMGSGGSVTVEAPVGDGDVGLKNLVLGTMEARIETGDVTPAGRFSGGGRISLRTGNITSRLPRGDTRELALEVRVGGIVRELSGREED